MRLKNVQITEFHSVRDSRQFDIGDITCLVGKNEAGKTALLQALYRLNPIIETEARYDVTDDYPRWDVEEYRINTEKGDKQHAIVCRADFEIEQHDAEAVKAVFGDRILRSRTLRLSKGYDNQLTFVCDVDEAAALRHLVTQGQFAAELESNLSNCDTTSKMIETLGKAEQTESVKKLLALVQEIQQQKNVSTYTFKKILWPRVPKLLYFDEYYQMEGRANIEALKQRLEQKALKPSDHPLLGLIGLARLDLNQLVNPSRTRELKNRLEGAGNHLTKRIVNYWTQNRHLHLRFDVRPARPEDPADMRSGNNIWGDVFDGKHMVTTEMGTRSRGFIWFFSFLAWYSDIQRRKQSVILLLDEPGLSLHAKAQEDLLRFFDAEVKGNHQLIYTTHSPFMVDPAQFDRVRIVQDLSIEKDEELSPENQGTKVLTDVLEATGESLFPLQGALGYEIYQTLFIGPNNLVVEGVSDLLYLQAMSSLLQQLGRTGLSSRWTITPVGGSDKVPTFVALIGAQTHLNVAVLIDFQKKDRQTVENLYKKKLLDKKKVVTFADFACKAQADIEDLFELPFYLKVVNAEFGPHLSKPVEVTDLNSHVPRTVKRLEEYFKVNPLKEGIEFNHYRAARHLSERLGILQGEISDATLDRFEKMFRKVNAIL